MYVHTYSDTVHTYVCIVCLDCMLHPLQNDQIPEAHKDSVVAHIVYVHLSVGDFSTQFKQKLRRVNHVTPKNYLDFINRYADLLKQQDKTVLDQVMMFFLRSMHLILYGISSKNTH